MTRCGGVKEGLAGPSLLRRGRSRVLRPAVARLVGHAMIFLAASGSEDLDASMYFFERRRKGRRYHFVGETE